ncbi:hypothetical protein Tco_1164239 [Tanacetum coccineum]
MFKDLKKFQAELDMYHDVNYASTVEINCVKAKGELISYKMSFEKSFNEYTRTINDLNQMISEMQNELIAHQETISIMSQEKEAQKKFHKTREDKELEKVIALENKIKCMTRSSTSELFTPYKKPEREFRSSRRHLKTLSLDALRSPDFNLFFDQEYLVEEVAETMAKTMEQYMNKTRADYGSGVARPKIEDKDNFELIG